MLALHDAADGRLARVRIPGGRLSRAAMLTLAAAAEELGNGLLDVTAQANLQLRGLRDGAEVAADLAVRLQAAGLPASPANERAPAVLASPLAGRAPGARDGVDEIVALLDAGLCASDTLRDLPGRFCVLADDGTGAGREASARALTRSANEPVEHWAGCERRCGEPSATPVSVAVAAIGVVEVRYHGDTWQLPSLASTTARLERQAQR